MAKTELKVVARVGNIELRLNADGQGSLTELWRANGSVPHKKPAKWLATDEAVAFMVEVAKQEKVLPEDLLAAHRGRNGGTWADVQVWLAYAQYLSTEFHVHVNDAYMRWVEEERTPAIKLERAKTLYLKRGMSLEWIKERFEGICNHHLLKNTMSDHNCRVLDKKTDNPFRDAATTLNLAVLGKTARELKDALGVKQSKSTRDLLTATQLKLLSIAEEHSAALIKKRAADGNRECHACVKDVGDVIRQTSAALAALA